MVIPEAEFMVMVWGTIIGFLIIIVLGIIGYIKNIKKLARDKGLGGETVLRGIGVTIPILGAIIGWF